MPKPRPEVAENPACEPRPRGRPPVPRERIVESALELLDQEGTDALSMRTLAERLGTGTAVLYRNVGSRDALVALVVDAVFGEIELDARRLAKLRWDRALLEIARTIFEVLKRHPRLVPLLAEQVPLGENALRLREFCLSLLLAAKLSPARAARLYATVARYVVGFAIQVRLDASSETQLSEAFRELDPALFPATVAVSAELPISIEDEFSFGLELLLAGASG